ncbi:MAG TPA: hypothetical protein VMF65_08500 [Acidimicrobiales bacterium]|nr:hypothetical protein [Acidimicrobiales bacterium]
MSTDETTAEPCPECGAEPGKEHASWCLATEDDDYDDEDADEEVAGYNQTDSRF